MKRSAHHTKTKDAVGDPAAIAVVGLSCRFPGEATSPETLWEMMEKGRNGWSEVPEDRFNISTFYHPSGNRQGTIGSRGAYFLKQNIAAFDTTFFSIPGEEAKAVDPQQRMLLEVTVEALDNAGIDRIKLRGSNTGVWVASFVKDYENIALRDIDNSPTYASTGTGTAIMSNRLSFYLDIHGPSMTIDTGCSGSLVAVDSAVQALRSRRTNMAIVGGAGLMIVPFAMSSMDALNFLSPDGKCWTFDARANGYGRGEGMGIVVLKRLDDAIRDNDNIRGVIRGSHVNQDGRTAGITLPNTEAQIQNIRDAYQEAKLSFAETAFVECHGTGTPAGDWRELKTISQTLSANRRDNPLVVGSVKTNIGHLEACAGIAGLIKTILTLEKGVIPQHLNFEAPGNPDIDFKEWGIKVPVKNTRWPVEGLRRASVNCFGYGGTNAHVIVDDAAHYMSKRGLEAHHNTTLRGQPPNSPSQESWKFPSSRIYKHTRKRAGSLSSAPLMPPRDSETQLFVFSAHDRDALRKVVDAAATYVESKRGVSRHFIENLAYTLGCRRTRMQWKTCVVAKSPHELVDSLRRLGVADFVRSSGEKPPKVAFIFGGQGGQWHAMGRELLGFDIFLQLLADASTYFKTQLACPWDIIEELLQSEGSSKIDKPEIAQSTVTILQVALVDLLSVFYGLRPAAVCGHSSGEIAAAYAMGAITRQNAWELAYRRGQCARAGWDGRMLAVGASESDMKPYVNAIGIHRVNIACINSPGSVTISGDTSAIVELQSMLQEAAIFCRMLRVTTAYHSHHMTLTGPEYYKMIRHIMPQKPRAPNPLPHPHDTGKRLDLLTLQPNNATGRTLPDEEVPVMYSSVTGQPIRWEDLGPSYWVRNLLRPVLFNQAVQSMMQQKAELRPGVLLELGPHSTLQGPIRQILDTQKHLRHRPCYISALSRKQDAAQTMMQAVGHLWRSGCQILAPWLVMRNLQISRPKLLVDMPNYPWNHDKTYWHESRVSRATRLARHGRYDLIGRPTDDSTADQAKWRGFIRISENPWIKDHQIQKTILYPAAGMVSMVTEGVKQLVTQEDCTAVEITNLRILKAMVIPQHAEGLEYVLHLNKNGDTFRFSIHSNSPDDTWTLHGDGNVAIICPSQPIKDIAASDEAERARNYRESFLSAQKACTEPVSPDQLYETFEVIGINYGRQFRNIKTLSQSYEGSEYDSDNGDNGYTCVGSVEIPDTRSTMPAGYEYPHVVHPATLDSVFQTAFSLSSDPMVPSSIDKIRIALRPDLLSGAGKQLLTHTSVGESDPSTRQATASYVVVDQAWLEEKKNDDENGHSPSLLSSSGSNRQHHRVRQPLITIEGMHLTSLSTAPGGASHGGFIPDYQSLCSEILWQKMEDKPELFDTPPRYPQHSLDASVPPFSSPQILLLVPELRCSAISNLCVEIMTYFNCQIHTLKSISGVEQEQKAQLPSYCLSLLETGGGQQQQTLLWNCSEREFIAFQHVVRRTRGMFWLTSTLDLEAPDPRLSLFSALARTIHSEDSSKDFVSLLVEQDDLPTPSTPSRLGILIANLFRLTFLEPRASTGSNRDKDGKPLETDYILQKGGHHLLIPRLHPIEELNDMIENRSSTSSLPPPTPRKHIFNSVLPPPSPSPSPSSSFPSDQQLQHHLAADEVSVRVLSTALEGFQFHSADHVTGETVMGTDFYGIVEVVGNNSSGISIGSHVVGVAAHTVAMMDSVRCHRSLVLELLQRSDHEDNRVTDDDDDDAMSKKWLPATGFTIAQYGLCILAQVDQGSTVLIPAVGAGSFGEAAVQIALSSGATVFVVVGDDEEFVMFRHFYNVPDGHIIDRRKVDVAERVMHLTDGKGVDIVYDALSVDPNPNLRCVAEDGHIIQLLPCNGAKKPTMQLTGKSVNLSVLDLGRLLEKSPGRLGEAFRSVTTRVLSGEYKLFEPQSRNVHGYSNMEAALRELTSEGRTGPTFIKRESTKLFNMLPKTLRYPVTYLRPDATYILSGGLGGLGIEIAKLLEARGVRNMIFVSRSGARTEIARECIAYLQSHQVRVEVVRVSICDRKALKKALGTAAKTMPPIRGVFQCAAALHDGVFDNMTYSDWRTAVLPKTHGSWNLYQAVLPHLQTMDFIIFLSSSAGIIGNRGQANYAAGNAYQDALARWINHQHSGNNSEIHGIIHATSLDLGPIVGAGMLAEEPRILKMLRATGFAGIRLREFRMLVERAIMAGGGGDQKTTAATTTPVVVMPTQVVTGVGTGGLTRQNKPADPYWTRTALFEVLNGVDLPPSTEDHDKDKKTENPEGDSSDKSGEGCSDNRSIKSLLASAPSSDEEAAVAIVTRGLRRLLARSMTMDVEDLDEDRMPAAYGVDSLVAVTVRDWVTRECGESAAVSVFEVVGERTVRELAELIVERGGLGAGGEGYGEGAKQRKDSERSASDLLKE